MNFFLRLASYIVLIPIANSTTVAMHSLLINLANIIEGKLPGVYGLGVHKLKTKFSLFLLSEVAT